MQYIKYKKFLVLIKRSLNQRTTALIRGPIYTRYFRLKLSVTKNATNNSKKQLQVLKDLKYFPKELRNYHVNGNTEKRKTWNIEWNIPIHTELKKNRSKKRGEIRGYCNAGQKS